MSLSILLLTVAMQAGAAVQPVAPVGDDYDDFLKNLSQTIPNF